MTDDQKTKGHCQVCGWEGVLTKNGRMRTHKGDPEKGLLAGGNCPGGSDLPRETAEQPVPKTESGGPNPHRAPLAADAPLGDAPCGAFAALLEREIGDVGTVLDRLDAPRHSCSACAEDGCIPCDGGPCCVALSDGSHDAAVDARSYDPDCTVCTLSGHHCFDCEKRVPHGSAAFCDDCQVFSAADDIPEAHVCDDCCGLCEDGECCQADVPTSYSDELRPTASDVRNAELVLRSTGDVPDDVMSSADNILAMATTHGVRPEPPEPDGADFFDSTEPGAPVPDEDAAAAFFDSEDPEQEPGKGRWFPSRYDGSCDNCGAYFTEGENIRADGSGGWQGEDCCGEDEDGYDPADTAPRAPKPVRPRRVAPKPPLRAGRYRLPHPETNKATSFSRTTTFVKLASDHRALTLWELRSALVGLSRQPDILDQVTGLDVKKDRDRLNALADMAKDAAGAKDRASTGTKLHKWTEEVDSGRLALEQVPDEFRTDVRRYREVLEASGYRVVPHLIERTTVVAELGVVGTFDQVWQAPDGRYVIVDKKTGELTYGQLEIAAQLAVYAHGANRHGVAEWDPAMGDADDPAAWVWRPLRDADGNRITVDETRAVVVHMPQDGRGITLLEVDLATGWEHVQVCDRVRAANRIKSTMSPLEVPDRDLAQERREQPAPDAGAALLARIGSTLGASSVSVPPQVLEPVPADFPAPETDAPGRPEPRLTWAQRFAAVRTKEEAQALLKEARDAGMPKARQDELVAMARQAKAA